MEAMLEQAEECMRGEAAEMAGIDSRVCEWSRAIGQ